MRQEDAAAACALTATEDWGFDESDFRRILDLWPGGSFVSEHDGEIVGMVTTSSYEITGWIGNVLVDASHRSSGMGSALVERALSHLDEKGMRSILLYAYEGLEGFYEGLGFERLNSYSSYRGRIRASRRRLRTERMRAEDMPDINRLDHYSFGDDRSRLLARILEEFPDTSLVSRSQGEVVGYAMAMTSDVLTNIGPVVSIGPGCETLLLESMGLVLEGREAFLVTASPSPFEELLDGLGLVKGFRVTRMARGPKPKEELDTTLAICALEKG